MLKFAKTLHGLARKPKHQIPGQSIASNKRNLSIFHRPAIKTKAGGARRGRAQLCPGPGPIGPGPNGPGPNGPGPNGPGMAWAQMGPGPNGPGPNGPGPKWAGPKGARAQLEVLLPSVGFQKTVSEFPAIGVTEKGILHTLIHISTNRRSKLSRSVGGR